MSLSTMTGAAGLALGVLAAGAVGAVTTTVAWKWQAATVAELKSENQRWQDAAGTAERQATRDQANSQFAVDRLIEMIGNRQDEYKVRFNEIDQNIDKVASTTIRCLRPPAVRLLDDSAGSSAAKANRDPGKVHDKNSRPAAAASGHPAKPAVGRTTTPAVSSTEDDGSGVSENEMTRWVNYARQTTAKLRDTEEFFQGVVVSSPHIFKIIPDPQRR